MHIQYPCRSLPESTPMYTVLAAHPATGSSAVPTSGRRLFMAARRIADLGLTKGPFGVPRSRAAVRHSRRGRGRGGTAERGAGTARAGYMVRLPRRRRHVSRVAVSGAVGQGCRRRLGSGLCAVYCALILTHKHAQTRRRRARCAEGSLVS